MTEAQWLACGEPVLMLEDLQGKASDRKLRLFAVVCVRDLPDCYPFLGDIIRACERYADGLVGWTELAAARKAARELQRESMQKNKRTDETGQRRMGAGGVRNFSFVADPSAFRAACGVLVFARERAGDHLREVFGNPFHPVAISPSWLSDTVVSLARAMYDSRDFSAMPILADALQDAGCEDETVLNHCRSGGVHVRGCWVIDLVLGKQ